LPLDDNIRHQMMTCTAVALIKFVPELNRIHRNR